MTQYNSLNVKLSNSQLNNDGTNFPYKLVLVNRQVANLRKAFANNLSADMKLSKTHLK